MDTMLFGGARDGVYLDIGCNDGRSNSNTWFFNMHRAWKGKCFEADPNMYRRIPGISGRRDAVHAAISSTDGSASFGVVNVADGGLSGIMSTLDHARAKGFGRVGQLSVPTMTPVTLLRTHYPNASKALDYVSIDVEGHELEVLRHWPLKGSAARRTAHAAGVQGAKKSGGGLWCVNVFTVENNHWCNHSEGILPQVKAILGDEYTHVRSVGVDEVFVRRSPCANAAIRLRPPPYSNMPPRDPYA